MRNTVTLALVSAAFSWACSAANDGSDSAARDDWTTVVDTIGDTIVVRTTGGADTAGARRLIPEVTIGRPDGAEEYTFGAINEVEVAPNGTIYVFDRQVPSLRAYDSAGRHLRTIGRKGGGPGEYEAANGLGVHRDGRVVLWDPGKASINVYTAGGETAASWPVPGGSGFYTSGAVFTDTAGNTYIRTTIADPPKDGSTPQARVFGRSGLVRWDASGVVLDSLAPPESAVPPAYITAQNKGSTSQYNVPFAPSFTWTFSPLGYFVSARTDRYAVTLSHRDGKATRIERDAESIAIESDERAEAEAIATARMRTMDPTWRWTGTPIPSTKPPIRSIMAGEDGLVWVSIASRGERIPEAERTPLTEAQAADPKRVPEPTWRQPLAYDVFEPEGRYLGRVRPPPQTTLRAMRGDHVWAVTRDSLDVEQVVRYRVTPGFGPRR